MRSGKWVGLGGMEKRKDIALLGMGGATRMAAMAMAMPLLGALWPLMAVAIALFCTMLFSVLQVYV